MVKTLSWAQSFFYFFDWNQWTRPLFLGPNILMLKEESNMEYRRLGSSGLKVSTLSFGSWVTFQAQVDLTLAEEMMKTAYDAGVNFFDNVHTTSNFAEYRVTLIPIWHCFNCDEES